MHILRLLQQTLISQCWMSLQNEFGVFSKDWVRSLPPNFCSSFLFWLGTLADIPAFGNSSTLLLLEWRLPKSIKPRGGVAVVVIRITERSSYQAARTGTSHRHPIPRDSLTSLVSLCILPHPSLPESIRGGLEGCIFLISATFSQCFKLQEEEYLILKYQLQVH